MDTKLKESVQTLCDALREDKSEGSYYHSWQANIAMAFKDEFHRYAADKEIEETARSFDVHTIANNAAKNFLDMLCHQLQPENK